MEDVDEATRSALAMVVEARGLAMAARDLGMVRATITAVIAGTASRASFALAREALLRRAQREESGP